MSILMWKSIAKFWDNFDSGLYELKTLKQEEQIKTITKLEKDLIKACRLKQHPAASELFDIVWQHTCEIKDDLSTLCSLYIDIAGLLKNNTKCKM